MSQDAKIPADFAAICEPGEKILWHARPVFLPYIAHAVPIVLLGIAWAMAELDALPPALAAFAGHAHLINGAPVLLRLVPAAICILHGLAVALAYGNTAYAYSNRRLLVRGGLIGTSFKTVDYDGIQDMAVTVGPIERLFNAGTIRAYSGRTTARGGRIYDQFVSIADPYDVFRALKQIEVDIKTDWEYPNALRPAANPGYATEYRPQA
jgi:membrane protein YdbS with pleckstrin-like domain